MFFDKAAFPETWQLKTIKEVYSFTKKPRSLSFNSDMVHFLPMESIPIGRIHVTEHEERPVKTLVSGTYVENGDLLVAKITPSFENGKQAIVDWDQNFGFATTEVIPIQELPGISDKYFLFHALLHPSIRSDLTGKMDGTTGRQRLSKDILGDYVIPVPPLSEQRKIAAVLGMVQRAIEEQEKLILLTTELKKSLLHKLFTEGLRGEPQKMTEIGLVPKSWNIIRITDAFEIQLGKMLSQKAHLGANPKPYLRNKNVQWGRIDVYDLLLMDFNESEAKKFALQTGDLLICEGGEPGRAAIWKGELDECYYQKALHRLRPRNASITNEFLCNWLKFSIGMQNTYSLSGANSTIAHLPAVQLKSLPIPLPKRSEQDRICEVLSHIEEKGLVLGKKTGALFNLFTSLLHKLMTAQIRVGDPS